MKYVDRDISWLAFNARVLQEAQDPKVALEKRLQFLAIYSSNLEEFYKVRVASHRFAQRYKGDKKNKFGYKPSFILQRITELVNEQQEAFGRIFKNEIVPAYKALGVHLIDLYELSKDRENIESLAAHIMQDLVIEEITNKQNVELINQAVYLYTLSEERQYLIHLDYKKQGRFLKFNVSDTAFSVTQLDDVVKLFLPNYIDHYKGAYAIKVSRDAELYIDEEQEQNIVKRIKKSIQKRESGMPSRLLFDQRISFEDINTLRKKAHIDMAGLVPGGRYHNFYDFFSFPSPPPKRTSESTPVKVPCKRLDNSTDWFTEIKKADILLSFPYQPYTYITEFLNRVCTDDQVTEISITLYRVAKDSTICQALEIAARAGKKVFVLDEVQARFDEESNIYWGERLEKAGAQVQYGIDKLKVHAKIFSIKRKEGPDIVNYSYLGTGNFNEKTAVIYADHAVLTTNESIGNEINLIFHFLQGSIRTIVTKQLLVAPFNLRSQLEEKIKREIEFARQGLAASFQIKLNSLEDLDMIDLIRRAADEGVQINLIVRGICCYTPLSEKQAKNIQVVSILDAYLEHTRIYHFNNNGQNEIYLASADWMKRNLSRRIEVAFPITDKQMQHLLLEEMRIQLQDGKKGRLVCKNNERLPYENALSSQEQMFHIIKKYND